MELATWLRCSDRIRCHNSAHLHLPSECSDPAVEHVRYLLRCGRSHFAAPTAAWALSTDFQFDDANTAGAPAAAQNGLASVQANYQSAQDGYLLAHRHGQQTWTGMDPAQAQAAINRFEAQIAMALADATEIAGRIAALKMQMRLPRRPSQCNKHARRVNLQSGTYEPDVTGWKLVFYCGLIAA